MTNWIRLTAIPNVQHLDDAPRAPVLINLDNVAVFKQSPGERVIVWFDLDERTPSIEVAESLEEIEFKLGMVPERMRTQRDPKAEWAVSVLRGTRR